MAAAAALRRSSNRHFLPLYRLRLFSTQSDPKPDPNPKSKPKETTLSILLNAIKSESDPDRIADLFQSSTHIARFYTHRPLYDLTVHKLSALHRTDLIERILESQRSDPKTPKTEGFLVRILSLYSASGMPDSALQLFDKIPKRTQLSFCALLSALFKNQKYDLAIEKFNQLPNNLGIEPDLVSYSLYLKALCAKGEVDAARKVLDEMTASRGLVPDIVCCNALLHGYLRQGNEDGFNEILKIISDKGLEPTSYTYNRRILMLCQKSQSFMAEQLLDVMVSKGLQPNLTSFNALIDGFCKEGDVDSAIGVLRKMQAMNRKSKKDETVEVSPDGETMKKKKSGKDGVSPNGETFVVLVRGLVEKGDFGLALKFCKECFDRKFVPPFQVVKGLVEGLAKNDRFEEAKDVVKKMNLLVRGAAIDAWKKVESSLSLEGRTSEQSEGN